MWGTQQQQDAERNGSEDCAMKYREALLSRATQTCCKRQDGPATCFKIQFRITTNAHKVKKTSEKK